jgi:hypothetical protein
MNISPLAGTLINYLTAAYSRIDETVGTHLPSMAASIANSAFITQTEAVIAQFRSSEEGADIYLCEA